MDKNYSRQNIKSRMNRKNKTKKKQGIANANSKNLSGQFFCPDNILSRQFFLSGQFFCPDNFFVLTIFLSGQFFVWTIFCPDNFFVQTVFCPDNFCPDNFFVRTIFLSGQKGIYHQVEFCHLPLDSETGWTGELWSKTNLLNWPN